MFQCFLIDKFSSSQWAVIMKPEIINELRVLFCIYVIFWFFFFFPSKFCFFFSFSQVLSALDILQPPHIDYFEEMYPNPGM